MALKKSILLGNGITVNYHRIAAVKLDCPYSVMITVNSYITADDWSKQKMIENNQAEQGAVFPYMESDFITIPYSNNLPILNGPVMKKAYEYLKQTEKYKDALDA